MPRKRRLVLNGQSATELSPASRPGVPRSDKGLVADLSSSDPAVVKRARDAFIGRGSAAVPLLLRCLDVDGDVLRQRALSLLAQLADARATGPVISQLRSPDRAVRARAAGALARLASPASIRALGGVLAREEEFTVRSAAVRSLVRMFQTGHEKALVPLLQVISDADDDPRVRNAALDAIPWTAQPGDDANPRAFLQRLADDPALGPKVKRMLGTPLRPRLEPWAIDKLLGDLASDSLAVWRRAVSRLSRAGRSVVEPVCEAICRAPDDRDLARRAVQVLTAVGPRDLGRLVPYLDAVSAPVPLGTFVEVVASQAEANRAILARLAALIHRLAAGPEANGPGPLDGVRQQAHLALARQGSRLAVDDLRRLLDDRRYPVRRELAEAASLIAIGSDLPVLLRAYRRSRELRRFNLRDAVLAVCRRERIRRTDRRLAQLGPSERLAADEIFGAPTRPTPRRRIARISRTNAPILN